MSIDSDEDTGTHQVKSEATSSSECLTEAIRGGNEKSKSSARQSSVLCLLDYHCSFEVEIFKVEN